MGEPSMPDGNRRTGWAELGLGGTVQLARPGHRFGARALDAIFLVVLSIIAFIVVAAFTVDDTNESSDFSTGATAVSVIFGLLLGIAYEVWPTARWGQTLGKRILGIKVVHAMTGEAPGWGKSMGRWALPALPNLISYVISFVLLFGWIFSLLCYVSLTWDRVYQGWHDKTAGTLVIRLR